MLNELKKVMLAGVGAVATTYEKASGLVDEMVKKGRLTVEEGKELSEELKRDFKEKASSTTKMVSEKIDEIKPLTKEDFKELLSQYEVVKKDELEQLKYRVSELEEKLNSRE